MRPIPDQVFPLAAESEGGFILKAYRDPTGKLTIGLGHLCTPSEHYVEGSEITLQQAKDIYKADASVAAAQVEHLVKVGINDNQFASLIDFTFNEGSGRLASSHLLLCLNAGNFYKAANEFSSWVYGFNPKTGKNEKLPGLIARREKEKALFLTPVTTP